MFIHNLKASNEQVQSLSPLPYVLFTAIVCEENSCGENEVCIDTAQGYVCQCESGYKKYQPNNCSKLLHHAYALHLLNYQFGDYWHII